MGKEVKKGEQHKIYISVMYKLSNSTDLQFFRVTDVSCVTSNKWKAVIGCINTPYMPSDVVLLEAQVFFAGPPAGVNFLVAEVFLTDISSVGKGRAT